MHYQHDLITGAKVRACTRAPQPAPGVALSFTALACPTRPRIAPKAPGSLAAAQHSTDCFCT